MGCGTSADQINPPPPLLSTVSPHSIPKATVKLDSTHTTHTHTHTYNHNETHTNHNHKTNGETSSTSSKNKRNHHHPSPTPNTATPTTAHTPSSPLAPTSDANNNHMNTNSTSSNKNRVNSPPHSTQPPLHTNTPSTTHETLSTTTTSATPQQSSSSSTPPGHAKYASNSSTAIRLKEKYELIDEILGKGHFAKVQKCRDIYTGTYYALKIIDKKDMVKSASIVKAEIEVLMAVRAHRHIVSLIDYFEDNKKFYLVMELCEGGDLFSKIVESGKYTEQQAVRCCRQLASALQHVHSCGVVHRDLKPENILLTTNDINADLKLADFGLSKLMKQDQSVMRTVCGTWAYCAPEVINRKPYTPMVDNWTLGVLMFILLSGYHPFDVYGDLPEADLLKRIVSCKYDFDDPVWDHISDGAKTLIKSLLKIDPKQRISLEEYLNTEWITQGKGAKEIPLPDIAKRIAQLDHGKFKFRTLILAKIASQKFKASLSRSNTPRDKTRRASGSNLGFPLHINFHKPLNITPLHPTTTAGGGGGTNAAQNGGGGGSGNGGHSSSSPLISPAQSRRSSHSNMNNLLVPPSVAN